MVFFIIPVGSIIVVLFVFIIVMFRIRQRRRNQTVFIPPRNAVMPMQPSRPNIQMPVQPTNPNYQMPMQPTQPIPSHNPYVANPGPPMPVPQPFSPAPVPSLNPSTLSQPTESELMERMRQVQALMVEIHRLESESGERNGQRVQELRQRVMELSNTDEHGRLHIPSGPVQPPPAYPSYENYRESPKYDGSG